MKPSSEWEALGLALVAAVANAVFVTAQKQVPTVDNPFYFLLFSLALSLSIWLLLSCFFPAVPAGSYLRQNGLWISIGGGSFALLSICFYRLSSRYGVSYYSMYAVLSLLITAIFSGILFFRETYNAYTVLSVGSACLSILFFYLSKHPTLFK